MLRIHIVSESSVWNKISYPPPVVLWIPRIIDLSAGNNYLVSPTIHPLPLRTGCMPLPGITTRGDAFDGCALLGDNDYHSCGVTNRKIY